MDGTTTLSTRLLRDLLDGRLELLVLTRGGTDARALRPAGSARAADTAAATPR